MGSNARTGSTPVPSTLRDCFRSLFFCCLVWTIYVVGEELCSTADAISLVCIQVRNRPISSAFAYGNIANIYEYSSAVLTYARLPKLWTSGVHNSSASIVLTIVRPRFRVLRDCFSQSLFLLPCLDYICCWRGTSFYR